MPFSAEDLSQMNNRSKSRSHPDPNKDQRKAEKTEERNDDERGTWNRRTVENKIEWVSMDGMLRDWSDAMRSEWSCGRRAKKGNIVIEWNACNLRRSSFVSKIYMYMYSGK